MRILSVGSMYPPHSLGGYELMWRSGVEQMREAGHQVRVLASDYRAERPEPAVGEDPDVHRELSWYWSEHEFPRLSLRDRHRLERHNGAVLRRHLRDFEPDVVNWWAMGGMSLSLLERVRRAGLPAVGVVIDDWMLYGPQVDAWQRACRRLGPLRPLVGALSGVPAEVEIGDAANWIFVSETTRRHAVAAGWELPSSEVVHGGINRSLFPPGEEHDWSGELLYLGRIDARKGISTAVAALAQLPQAFTLRVVGGGDERHRSELETLVSREGLERRVRFESVPRSEVAQAYAEADAVLFPVLWEEPWGLVPLEAMSVGTPVIATGTGGSGEYLRDSENCLIFSPRDDPAALARAVRRLADDAGLRRRLREGGFATADRFDERSFNAAIIEALERVTR